MVNPGLSEEGILNALSMKDRTQGGFMENQLAKQYRSALANQANAVAANQIDELKRNALAMQIAPLAARGDPEALNALAVLNSKAHEAIQAEMRRQKVAPLIEAALNHPDERVRRQALGMAGAADPSVLGSLANAAQYRDAAESKRVMLEKIDANAPELAEWLRTRLIKNGGSAEEAELITPDLVRQLSGMGVKIPNLIQLTKPRSQSIGETFEGVLTGKDAAKVAVADAKARLDLLRETVAESDDAANTGQLMTQTVRNIAAAVAENPDAFTLFGRAAPAAAGAVEAYHAIRDVIGGLSLEHQKLAERGDLGQPIGDGETVVPADALEQAQRAIKENVPDWLADMARDSTEISSFIVDLVLMRAALVGLGEGRYLTNKDYDRAAEGIGASGFLSGPTALITGMSSTLISAAARVEQKRRSLQRKLDLTKKKLSNLTGDSAATQGQLYTDAIADMEESLDYLSTVMREMREAAASLEGGASPYSGGNADRGNAAKGNDGWNSP